ncbi:hypothetical protein [Streptomyces sp. NPDC002057]|uniref:hypothetical protein n=1 Tax=Streptomyces sp. NPDC002057 TaxID=3154664 RepID=UPI00332B603F
MSDPEAAAEAERILRAEFHDQPRSSGAASTSFRDDTPLPTFGPTPPVLQPETRVVPAWAAGTAVGSIGIGAGITGVGCGAWLVLQGLAAVTLTSVLMVTLPLAALAALATTIGSALQHARATVTRTENHYTGPVTHHVQHTEQTARGLPCRITHRWSRSPRPALVPTPTASARRERGSPPGPSTPVMKETWPCRPGRTTPPNSPPQGRS